jgi:hypothetical protein
METLQEIFERNKDKYRALTNKLDGFDASQKDDVVKILMMISQVFVDNSLGLGAVDLAIQARNKITSQTATEYDKTKALASREPVDLDDILNAEGEISKDIKNKQIEDYSP